MLQHGESFKQAEAIKISKVCNTLSIWFRLDFSFVSSLKTIVNYVDAFELEYIIKFMEAHFTYNVFLIGAVKDVYSLRLVHSVCQVFSKERHAPSSTRRLSIDVGREKNLCFLQFEW